MGGSILESAYIKEAHSSSVRALHQQDIHSAAEVLSQNTTMSDSWTLVRKARLCLRRVWDNNREEPFPPCSSVYEHVRELVTLCLIGFLDVRRPWCYFRILLSFIAAERSLYCTAWGLRFLHLIDLQDKDLSPINANNGICYLMILFVCAIIINFWPRLTAAWRYWPTERQKILAESSHHHCQHCTKPYEKIGPSNPNMRVPIVLSCCNQVHCNHCTNDISARGFYSCPFCRLPRLGEEDDGNFGVIRRQHHITSMAADCVAGYDPSRCDICEGDYSTAASIARLEIVLPCCRTVVCYGCLYNMAMDTSRSCAYCGKRMSRNREIPVQYSSSIL